MKQVNLLFHDIQHKDIQHNETKNNNTQNNDTQHNGAGTFFELQISEVIFATTFL
jgi:hypothetical protein